MTIAEWTREEFQEYADSGRFMIVAWLADRDVTPVPHGYHDAASALGDDIYFGQLKVSEHTELAGMFDVGAGPTLMIMRDRIVLYCEPGFPETSLFRTLLGRVARLDMSAVRADIQAERDAELALHVRRVCPTVRRSR